MRLGKTGIAALLAMAAMTTASVPGFAQQAAPTLPPGPGLDLIKSRCTVCHAIDTITEQRNTPSGWADTVSLMASQGAQVNQDEMKVIADYLAKNLPAH